jgi:hypothetical protein
MNQKDYEEAVLTFATFLWAILIAFFYNSIK